MIRTIMRDGDALAGAVLAMLGVHILVKSLSWDLMGPEGPGPGFFPLGYGALMIVLSLVLIASRVTRDVVVPNAPIDWRSHVRPLGTWLAFALAALLMPVVGFLLAFGALSLFMTIFVFARPFGTALAVGVLCPLGFWIVFPILLDVRLPVGRLGF